MRRTTTLNDYTEETYGIVEVFYDYEGEDETKPPVIWGWSSDFEAPRGETPEELRSYIDYCLDAFLHPILDEAELLAQMKDRTPNEEGALIVDLDDVALD